MSECFTARTSARQLWLGPDQVRLTDQFSHLWLRSPSRVQVPAFTVESISRPALDSKRSAQAPLMRSPRMPSFLSRALLRLRSCLESLSAPLPQLLRTRAEYDSDLSLAQTRIFCSCCVLVTPGPIRPGDDNNEHGHNSAACKIHSN
eukprot:3633457-Rhodomonas_salina.1